MEDSVEKLPVNIYLESEPDQYAEVPLWSLTTVWVSTIVLSLAFIIGLPLNGATVLIFWRRKKLRHLVNFVLLLDCVSHIILCLVCIPIHLTAVWSSSSLAATGLQILVENYCNAHSTFQTLSIAILRYRRLCFKKKDKLNVANAIKWSLLPSMLALFLTGAQSYSSLLSDDQKTNLTFFLIKISLILISMAIVVFCYLMLSYAVWANAANQEKVKRKSRSVHLRATMHSCVQIVLIIVTLSPHLYEQTLEAMYANSKYAQPKAEELQTSTQSNHGEDEFMTDEEREDSHFARLINYALLILGTPMAYIASCHRFREQFTSILFSHILNSPQNSACQNPHSPRHPQQRNQFSSCRRHAQQQRRTFSNPSSGRPYFSTTTSRTTTATSVCCNTFIPRNSISVSTNNTSFAVTMSRNQGGSTKSGNSMKRCTSKKRKESRGLLGTEFIIADSESTTMLDQDVSNSTNPKETPTPSPPMTDGSGCAKGVCETRKGSIFCTNLQTAFVTTSIETVRRKNSLQTVLQNYGYDFSDDLGELV